MFYRDFNHRKQQQRETSRPSMFISTLKTWKVKPASVPEGKYTRMYIFVFDHLVRTIGKVFLLIPAGVEANRPLGPANRGSINGVRMQMRRSLQNPGKWYSFQPITESWLALVLSHSSTFHNLSVIGGLQSQEVRWFMAVAATPEDTAKLVLWRRQHAELLPVGLSGDVIMWWGSEVSCSGFSLIDFIQAFVVHMSSNGRSIYWGGNEETSPRTSQCFKNMRVGPTIFLGQEVKEVKEEVKAGILSFLCWQDRRPYCCNTLVKWMWGF